MRAPGCPTVTSQMPAPPATASCVPSGDQASPWSSQDGFAAGLRAITSAGPPFAGTALISAPATNAMRAPSGDQASAPDACSFAAAVIARTPPGTVTVWIVELSNVPRDDRDRRA